MRTTARSLFLYLDAAVLKLTLETFGSVPRVRPHLRVKRGIFQHSGVVMEPTH